MKNRNEQGLNTTEIHPDIAKAYSKNGCKTCYGKGLLNYISPDGENYSNYCSCVEKNLRKQKL